MKLVNHKNVSFQITNSYHYSNPTHLIHPFADHWTTKCIYAAADVRGVPGRVFSDGADGREPLPGDTNGSRPRANVLFAVPDALRHQALALGRNHS